MRKKNIRIRKKNLVQPLEPLFSSKKDLVFILGLILYTFIIFSPAVNNDFNNWDDNVNITENENIKKLSSQNIKKIFSTSVIGGFTPLTTLSFAIEYSIAGLNPKVYHTNNIVLHVLCTCLVYLLFRLLGLNPVVAIIISLLFGIHPMRVESVAWATERKDVLFGFFYLLSMLFYVQFFTKKKSYFYILSVACFIFSLLSKSQAVFLPISLLLIDYLAHRKFSKKVLYEKIPFFILSLIVGLIGIHFLIDYGGSTETDKIYSISQRFLLGTYSLFNYIIKSLIPYQLSAFYPYPKEITLHHYLSLIVVLVILIIFFKSKKLKRELVFGTLFFLSNIIFLLQIVSVGYAYMADRFSYIPYIGLFYIFAILYREIRNSKIKKISITFFALYLVVLSAITYTYTKTWKNSISLWSDVIEKYPESSHIIYNNRAVAYVDIKNYSKALIDYNKALEIKDDYYKALSGRGTVHFYLKDYEKAEVDLTSYLRFYSDDIKLIQMRAMSYFLQNKFENAISDYGLTIKLEPNNGIHYKNRAFVYIQNKNNQLALKDLIKAKQLGISIDEDILKALQK